jgi:hypothetical protein
LSEKLPEVWFLTLGQAESPAPLERWILEHLRSCRCWSQNGQTQGLAEKDNPSDCKTVAAGVDRGVCGMTGVGGWSMRGDRGLPLRGGASGGMVWKNGRECR